MHNLLGDEHPNSPVISMCTKRRVLIHCHVEICWRCWSTFIGQIWGRKENRWKQFQSGGSCWLRRLFQANSLRFSDWHLGFSRIPISSSNTGTSTKSKPIYVPPLILTGFYTWGVSCQYRYILLQSSTFVDASQDTFGCDTKIIWRTTGWTAGGIDKDLGCLIGYLGGSF